MARTPVRAIIARDQPLIGRTDDTVQTAAERMAEHRCGSILVCDGGKLRGIFTEGDLLVRVVAARRDPARTKLFEVMTPDPDTVAASEPVVEAVRQMDACGYRHLPVVEAGRVIGMISIGDLIHTIILQQDETIGQLNTLISDPYPG